MAINMEEFRKDLVTMSIEECCKKHQISFSQITQLCIAQTKKRTAKKNRETPKKVNPNKHICSRGGRHYIQKQIGEKRFVFGMFRTIEDARIVRDGFVECGWDTTQFENILRQKKVKLLPFGTCLKKDSYIQKTEYGTFSVKKNYRDENGNWKTRYFGTYASIEDARKIRDGLIEYGWNKQQLFRIKKKYGITNTYGR